MGNCLAVQRTIIAVIIMGMTILPIAVEASETTHLQKVGFAALENWSDAQAQKGLAAFQRSCMRGRTAGLTVYGRSISASAWKRVCASAQRTTMSNARDYFEQHFQPYRVTTDTRNTGLLTGYYTPTMDASLTPSPEYPVPLYRKPAQEALRTRHSRAEIEAGALSGKNLELLWLRSAIDAFFLHVQGSGYAHLPDGRVMKLVFAGKNDFPYTAIGKQFVQDGVVSAEDMSMQWLRTWLAAHPEQAASVMQRNASFIFFAMEAAGEGVKGGEGTLLTPQHSVAIDTSYLSYGTPMYVHTQFPNGADYAAMVIAQDTGSAIKGALRGDLYTGVGEEAGELAGKLKSPAEFFVLLPE
jgi:membrane-bound lytic murein transglycosylase A